MESPSLHPLLDFFLRAGRNPVVLDVAMCMVIINTHMSMHVSIEWKADAISGANIDCGVRGLSRGMLAGTTHGSASGPRGGANDRPGGHHIPPTFASGRREAGKEAGGASPSRTRGAGSSVGVHLEVESSSESE